MYTHSPTIKPQVLFSDTKTETKWKPMLYRKNQWQIYIFYSFAFFSSSCINYRRKKHESQSFILIYCHWNIKYSLKNIIYFIISVSYV